MSNTHAIADTAYELQATCEDLLPACVISTTFPTVPVSSMTLAAFATQAYVRDAQALVYVDQSAITLTLTGSDGTYWLAASRDVSTAYASWTRRAGSHYLWRLSGTRPPDVDGLLVFCSATVAGGVVTAVTPAPGVTRAEAWRTLGGLGTMATQNASAVAVTGGNIAVNLLGLGGYPTDALSPLNLQGNATLNGVVGIGGAPNASQGGLSVYGTSWLNGNVGLGGALDSGAKLHIRWDKSTSNGIIMLPGASDVSGNMHLMFKNISNSIVGSVVCNASATAYNTSSDVRLKHAIAALTGALDAIAALKPVRFRWNADDSADEGFLAHELQQVLPRAVTGEPDAVHDDGSVKPQQVDHSKLVVWLVGAVQELAARVTSLEEQLGL